MKHRLFAFFLSLSTLLVAPGCRERSEASSESAGNPEPPTAPARPTQVQNLMREHFLAAREVRQAIIGDDLEAARDSMSQLAETYPVTTLLPAEMRPAADALRDDATAFGEAAGLGEAAGAFARVIVHCGECHEAVNEGPTFATPPLPEGSAPAIQMNRHRWGIERMWEGLVARDPDLYDDGATVLAEVELEGDGEDDGTDRTFDVVRREAAAAQNADAWAERANHYGTILATCAGCHRAMGVSDFARTAGDGDRPVGP